MYRLPETTSIFTAELFAVHAAVKYIKNTNKKYVVLIDSKSVIDSIKYINKNPIVHSIYRLLKNRTIDITFMWIPSHRGIIFNEKADKLAKLALEKNIST